MATPAPFSRYEFLIAWRYLRAKRAEGGVSVMTWISLVGITLAVFALIQLAALLRVGFALAAPWWSAAGGFAHWAALPWCLAFAIWIVRLYPALAHRP